MTPLCGVATLAEVPVPETLNSTPVPTNVLTTPSKTIVLVTVLELSAETQITSPFETPFNVIEYEPALSVVPVPLETSVPPLLTATAVTVVLETAASVELLVREPATVTIPFTFMVKDAVNSSVGFSASGGKLGGRTPGLSVSPPPPPAPLPQEGRKRAKIPANNIPVQANFLSQNRDMPTPPDEELKCARNVPE